MLIFIARTLLPLIGLAYLILLIYSITDILKHEFTGNNKIVWILVVIFFQPLGAILYLLMGDKHKINIF